MVFCVHTITYISPLTFLIEDASLQHLDQEIFIFYISYMSI